MSRAISLPLSLAAALLSTPAAAIVGPSRDGEALTNQIVMVLALRAGRQSVCSGVALGPRVVLTAAHCVAGAHETLAAIRVGGRTQPIVVAAVERNPAYDPDAPRLRRPTVDLALIETATDLPDNFAFAEIADPPGVGEPLQVAGFGVTREGGPPSDGHARVADLQVSAPMSAKMLWARDPEGKGSGACHGDSGGPILTAKGEIAAVVGWTNGENGHGCGAITEGSLAAPARDWIASVRRRWSGAGAKTP